MVDNEHDSIDYSRLAVWSGIIFGCSWFWYSVFAKGFFVSFMWLIVVSAIIVLCLRMSGRI